MKTKQNGKPVITVCLTSLKLFFLDIRKREMNMYSTYTHTHREKGSGKIVKTNAVMLVSV